jgi:hypothetical protein
METLLLRLSLHLKWIMLFLILYMLSILKYLLMRHLILWLPHPRLTYLVQLHQSLSIFLPHTSRFHTIFQPLRLQHRDCTLMK